MRSHKVVLHHTRSKRMRMSGLRQCVCCLLQLICIPVVLVLALLPASAFTAEDFPVPTPASGPNGITAGPDGNVWFTEIFAGQIGRITQDGVVGEFPIPTANSQPYFITSGPDGNLWFTEYKGNKIGRITPAGVITEFPVPTVNALPVGITSGPDGNLWFTEYAVNKVAVITPGGAITEFSLLRGGLLAANGGPWNITTGPDGNLWCTEPNRGAIARITPAGVVTETQYSSGVTAGITTSADNNLWFCFPDSGLAARFGTAGQRVGSPGTADPTTITPGRDGSLWFTEYKGNKIGQISPQGTATEYSVLAPNSNPVGITTGPDGNIWYAERSANRIGRFVATWQAVGVTPDPYLVPGPYEFSKHILWTNPNGQMVVSSSYISTGSIAFGPIYGPYLGWTAKSISSNQEPDNRTGSLVLWTRTDGMTALWVMGMDNSLRSYSNYGPF